MNILIVNSSPRKEGNISTLLNHAHASLSEAGHCVEFFNVYDAKFAFCAGCMACRSLKKCVLPQDDAHRFADAIQRADIIIFGAPCYWGNIPGALKAIFDRIVYALIDDKPTAKSNSWLAKATASIPKPLLTNKKAIIITSATTPNPWARLTHQTSGVIRAFKQIFRFSGIKIIGSLQHADSKNISVGANELKHLDKLISLALK